MTKIVALSDTHRLHKRCIVPEGDILIHAGDFSFDYKDRPEPIPFVEFLQWFESYPHKHKILVGGNHDQLLERQPELARGYLEKYAPSVTYLEDAECVVPIDGGADGLTIWGSPMTPSFFDWSFNRNQVEIINHWDKIPEGIDVLVTHGPPLGFLDKNKSKWDHNRCGCPALQKAVERTKPLLHIFGHVHGGYGRMAINRTDGSITRFCNVSVVNENYTLSNPVTEIEL